MYADELDLFLINIRDPAGVSILSPETLTQKAFIPVSVSGPHGLDIDGAGHAFVACDGKAVVVLEIRTSQEGGFVPIAGEPDVVWHNPRRDRLYCAIAKPGLVEVIDTEALTIVEEIGTEDGTHIFAFDQTRQQMYVLMPKTCRAALYEEVKP